MGLGAALVPIIVGPRSALDRRPKQSGCRERILLVALFLCPTIYARSAPRIILRNRSKFRSSILFSRLFHSPLLGWRLRALLRPYPGSFLAASHLPYLGLRTLFYLSFSTFLTASHLPAGIGLRTLKLRLGPLELRLWALRLRPLHLGLRCSLGLGRRARTADIRRRTAPLASPAVSFTSATAVSFALRKD